MVYLLKLFLALAFAVVAITLVVALATGSQLYWTFRDEYPNVKVGMNCSYFGFWMRSWALDKKVVLAQDCGANVSSPYVRF